MTFINSCKKKLNYITRLVANPSMQSIKNADVYNVRRINPLCMTIYKICHWRVLYTASNVYNYYFWPKTWCKHERLQPAFRSPDWHGSERALEKTADGTMEIGFVYSKEKHCCHTALLRPGLNFQDFWYRLTRWQTLFSRLAYFVTLWLSTWWTVRSPGERFCHRTDTLRKGLRQQVTRVQ